VTCCGLVLEGERDKIRRKLRRDQWITYLVGPGMALFGAAWLWIAIVNGVPAVYVAAATVGVIAFAVWVAAFWISHGRQAQRERAFGNSLKDEIGRNLSLVEYKIANGGWGAALLWTVPVLMGALMIYWLTFQINTDTGLSWWNHALTVWAVVVAIALTAWASDREVKRKLEPRRQRLRELLETSRRKRITERAAYSAATACPTATTAASSLRCAPCWRRIARTSPTSTSRGCTPAVGRRPPAPTPAAWPVSQHCGISRMNPWLLASHEMCRPAASSPSSARGTRQPYGHRDHRELGADRRADPDLVRPPACRRPSPCASIRARPGEDAGYGRTPSCAGAVERERALEPRRVPAEELGVAFHQPVAADLDLGHVVDVERREARLARAEPHRHVGPPGDVGRLEEAELLPPALHHRAQLVGMVDLPVDPAVHVDPADDPRGVHRVVDVAFLDVGVERGPGAGEHVAVAGGVDHDLGEDRLAPALALEDHALGGAVLDQRPRGPGVEHEPHAGCKQHLLVVELHPLGIERRRPLDDAVERGGAVLPVLDLGRDPSSPSRPAAGRRRPRAACAR
jgi:hypothetical protein